jgi:hypothetical protein
MTSALYYPEGADNGSLYFLQPRQDSNLQPFLHFDRMLYLFNLLDLQVLYKPLPLELRIVSLNLF